MRPLVIGIAGGSGSGKTTLARAVVAQAPCPASSLAFDSYYCDQVHLSPAERAEVNYDHPDSLDVALFIEHLAQMREGQAIEAPVYDFASHTRTSDVEFIAPEPLVVVDGILLLVFPQIRELLDLGVFVEVTDELRTERRLYRDVAERGRTREMALAQIAATVQPMHEQFVAPSRAHADIVIDGKVPAEETAGLVLARLPLSV